MRHLPLLFGDKVPVNDPKWETLLQLRDVLFYVCAPALDRGHILSMSDVIEDFIRSYTQTFPNETVKPKLHYMLHYPYLTSLFGPLIHLNSLRFEGKHNYFKELVFRTKNKKNLCKSLAGRHQYYQCTFNASENFLSLDQLDSTGGSTIPICLFNNDIQQLFVGIHQGQEVFTCKSLTVSGITYWKGTCVVRGLEGFLLQFCKIFQCVIVSGIPYLLCQKLRTVDFDRHFHAFVVSDTARFELVKIPELPEPTPLGVYDHPTHLNYQLVVAKYKVLS